MHPIWKDEDKEQDLPLICFRIFPIVLFLALFFLITNVEQKREYRRAEKIREGIQKYGNIISLKTEHQNGNPVLTEVVDIPEESFQIMFTFDTGDYSFEMVKHFCNNNTE